MPAAALKLLYGVADVHDDGSHPAEVTPPPLYPPLDWFTDEAADAAPSKLRLFPDGRIAGVVAPANRCLLDGSGECWMIPRPKDGRGSTLTGENGDREDYRLAHVGATFTADGYEIPTAALAGPGGHANPYAGPAAARSHYDNTDFQVGRGRYVWSDKAGGLVFVGAAWPDLGEKQVAMARASACSVDYRWIGDESQYRLIATCLVNVGGLPSRYASLLDSDDAMVITPDMVSAVWQAESTPRRRLAIAASLGFESVEDLLERAARTAGPDDAPATDAPPVNPGQTEPAISADDSAPAPDNAPVVDKKPPTHNHSTHPLSERQIAEAGTLRKIAQDFGKYAQDDSADGAWYAKPADNKGAARGVECSNCTFYDGQRACEIVTGDVDPGGMCKLWIVPSDLVTEPVAAEPTAPAAAAPEEPATPDTTKPDAAKADTKTEATPMAQTAAPEEGCTECDEAEAARTAAYAVSVIPATDTVLGPSASPQLNYGDEVTWKDGLGMFTDTVNMADGTTSVLVIQVKNGMLDFDDPVAVAAADATATGRMFQYVAPEDLPDNVVIENDESSETPAEEAAEGALTDVADDDDTGAMMASLGHRLVAGRVPVGAAVTDAEVRLAAVSGSVSTQLARVEGNTAARLAATEQMMDKIATNMAGLTEVIGAMHSRMIASELNSL